MNPTKSAMTIIALAVLMVTTLGYAMPAPMPSNDLTTAKSIAPIVPTRIFNPVAQVLYGIAFMCVIFTALLWARGEWLKKFVKSAGWAILLFGALPHAGSWFYAMSTGNTPATILICMFLGFWLFLGTMLIKDLKEEMDKVLLVIEPVMMLIVLFFGAFFYGQHGLHRDLQLILLAGLFPIILFLWMSKLPIKFISLMGLWLARLCMLPLGAWAFYLLLLQTKVATP